MNIRFGDIRLLVTRYAETFRFYRDALGLTVDWGDETTGYAQFKADTGVLALLERADMGPIAASGDGGDRVVLSFLADDVDLAYRTLVARGAPSASEPHDRTDWGYRVAHVRDPEGNLIELYARIH